MVDNITTTPFKAIAKVDGAEIIVDASSGKVVITIYDRWCDAEIKMDHTTFKEFIGAIRDLRI